MNDREIDNMVNMPYNNSVRYTVEYYVLSNGKSPVKELLNDLEDKKLKAKVYWVISLLETHSRQLNDKYIKYLREGVFELRIKHSTNIVRCLFFYYKNRIIVLTNSFVKKIKKTPQSEINRAIEYKKDYLKKHKGENYYG